MRCSNARSDTGAGYDPARGAPLAWLVGIARRVLADRAVSGSRPVADVPETAAPGELEHEAVERLTLAAALARLSERDRELLAMRYGADMKAAEIAQVLESTTNAVEVAVHRALRRLRACSRRATSRHTGRRALFTDLTATDVLVQLRRLSLARAAPGLLAAAVLTPLAAGNGGYFPPAWGWSAAALLWAAAIAVLARDEIEITRPRP